MSSFVFVVIVAVWAVYLVQHWVRRRDHLATARSVDRFSEAMRVLERRRELPVPEPGSAPRSYAASPLRPARPGRPEVAVKSGVHGATAVAPSASYRRSRAAARLRAGVLLLGSLAMVALVTLAAVGVLQRWWAVVGVGAATLAVVLVRWSVPAASAGAASRRTRRPAARVHHPAARPERRESKGDHQFAAQTAAVTMRAPVRRGAVVAAGPSVSPVAHDAGPSVSPVAHDAGPSVSPVPYDLVEVEAAPQPQQPVAAEQDAGPVVQPTDGTWHPVPVPPPTYTLKAAAPPSRPYGSVSSGSVSLPADGTEMALEEEYEDLPRIDLVG
ncbi:MAG: hypothetical protein DCC50_01075 [Acidobacteria bacterium]|nr:MAG: hypothetical protein DCC50_01075 [Acidobacteriota bacterium]